MYDRMTREAQQAREMFEAQDTGDEQTLDLLMFLIWPTPRELAEDLQKAEE